MKEKLDLGCKPQGKGLQRHMRGDLGGCGGLEHGVCEVGALDCLSGE